jgi:copper homeostasis protein
VTAAHTSFELAVSDAHGIAVAAACRVDRVELCSALPLGGVTPSQGLVEAALGTPAMPPVHVLVRPRPGGFAYDDAEAAIIVRDVANLVAAGVAGVVVGGLRDGRVDAPLVRRVVAAAAGVSVTFHRAFDALPDPFEGIDALVALGVDRILTAAGAVTVGSALPRLGRLVAHAAGRLEVMAGGGVHAGLVKALVATGVPAVHGSAKRTVADPVGLVLGTASTGDELRETTDEDEVRRILAALHACGARR